MSAEAVGEVYRAAFEEEYDQLRVWQGLVQDMSSEAAFGDAINVPVDDNDGAWTQVTLANAQGGTLSNHNWPTATIPQATEVKLNIDQIYRINRLIPNVNILQLRPNQVTSQGEFAARRAANLVNNYIRSRIEGITASGSLLPSLSASAANFASPTQAVRDGIRAAFYAAEEDADYGGWPVAGRYCKVSPWFHTILERYFEDAKIPYQTVINDQVTAQGVILRLSGFDIIKDPSAGAGKTNTDDAKHIMVFGVRGRGAAYAEQQREIRVFDGIDGGPHDGVGIRGRLVYGAVVTDQTKYRLMKPSIT